MKKETGNIEMPYFVGIITGPKKLGKKQLFGYNDEIFGDNSHYIEKTEDKIKSPLALKIAELSDLSRKIKGEGIDYWGQFEIYGEAMPGIEGLDKIKFNKLYSEGALGSNSNLEIPNYEAFLIKNGEEFSVQGNYELPESNDYYQKSFNLVEVGRTYKSGKELIDLLREGLKENKEKIEELKENQKELESQEHLF